MQEPKSMAGTMPIQPWSETRKLIAEVLSFAPKKHFAPGDPVLQPETKSEVFYYVETGRVEVSYTGECLTTITVALIGAGEFFGEIGFFDQGSRVRTIVASEDADIAIFTREVMETIREQQPDLYIDFLLYLTRKICIKFRQISSESSPIAAYADSIADRRSCKYTGAKPLPSELLRSDLWKKVHEQVERISMEFFNMSLLVQDASEETGKGPLKQQCMEVLTEFVDNVPLLAEQIDGSPYDDVLWGYIFKEIYPYFMRSHYAERSYHKPKGYAGDFLMIEHVYNNIGCGDGHLGELIDEFCLNRPASKAIRGRRRLLADQLARLTAPLAQQGNQISIMNLACGPNRELFDFLAHCKYGSQIKALCIDIDAEALEYTNKNVDTFFHGADIKLMQENVIKWSLGRVKHQIEQQDIIYSAGLCDYLDDRLFKKMITRCYQYLKPGGTLILGNFDYHKDAVFMDRILRWELIYRSRDQLAGLFTDTPFATASILSEEERINLFALAVRE